MSTESRSKFAGQSSVTAEAYCADGDGAVGRTYLCASCYNRAIICSRCDRGQIYCSRDCAGRVRRARLLEAGRRYQATDRGRRLHAERNRRYRERNRRVTHQGSAPEAIRREITSSDVAPAVAPSKQMPISGNGKHCCHFCGSTASEFVRQRFLRPTRGSRANRRRRRGAMTRSGIRS